MDPNANLAEQRRLCALLNEHGSKVSTADRLRAAERLADLVQALDEWLASGSFLPDAWQRGRPGTRNGY